MLIRRRGNTGKHISMAGGTPLDRILFYPWNRPLLIKGVTLDEEAVKATDVVSFILRNYRKCRRHHLSYSFNRFNPVVLIRRESNTVRESPIEQSL